jgi:hypothetical protein
MKRGLLVLVCLFVLAAAAPAGAARVGLTTDRGILQSVSPLQLVLRSLDGSTLVFQIKPRTVILVNGQPATVSALQAGFAATVVHDALGRAHEIRAIGQKRAERQIDKGVVVSVSPSLLVLKQSDGSVVSVQLSPRTVVTLDGLLARITDLRPGDLVAVLHYGSAPAREVRAVPRPQRKLLQ